jgi:predicted outer membrane repeat protein
MSMSLRCLAAFVLLFCLSQAALACSNAIYVGETNAMSPNYDAACTANSVAQAASMITCSQATIVVTRERSYTAQHIAINGKTVTLIAAGYDVGCDGNQHCDVSGCHGPGVAPLLSLAGSSGANVLSITGNSDVLIDGFYINGGHSSEGGGIAFDGNGTLTITNSSISNNKADYGGGIAMTGGSAGATLSIGTGTLILGNEASTSGGGIRIEGQSRLLVLGDNILISGNSTTSTSGFGGGVEVLGPARADIGASGYGAGGVIQGNGAGNGGGVAVIENGNGSAVLRMFARDLSHPSVLSNNSATHLGGAIYLSGKTDACLFAPRIEGNTAEDGAAIYKYDSGGIYINNLIPARLGSECGPDLVSDLGGAKRCNYAANCDVINENTAQHADLSPADGSIIHVQFGELVGSRWRMQKNKGGGLIVGSQGGAFVSRCLMTDNTVTDALISYIYWGSGSTTYQSCTIANNSIGGDSVFQFSNQNLISLKYDIIEQPGVPSVYFSPYENGATITAGYIMSNDISTIPHAANPSIVQDDPHFVDAALGDYHLRSNSPALDFAPEYDDPDLDCNAYIYDLPGVSNKFGTTDLGPYETSNNDRIFASGIGDLVKPLNGCP